MRFTAVVCLCALATGASSIEARQSVRATDAETFRQKLLDAFARGDRRAVAGMVRYRLVVDAGGLMIPVVDRATLLQMWDVVFPPEVRCLMEESGFQHPGQVKPKYLVQARAGDLLNAQLERVGVEDASLRVVQQTGNRVLSATGPTGSDVRRLWAGKVPASGEYRVEVVRRGAYCDPSVNYLLKVSLE